MRWDEEEIGSRQTNFKLFFVRLRKRRGVLSFFRKMTITAIHIVPSTLYRLGHNLHLSQNNLLRNDNRPHPIVILTKPG